MQLSRPATLIFELAEAKIAATPGYLIAIEHTRFSDLNHNTFELSVGKHIHRETGMVY